MNDTELIQALRHIGVDRDTIRALPLLPLVQVAWADGRIQDAERGLIREVAVRYGLNQAEAGLLESWLAKQPEEADFLLARRVLLVLWSRDREKGNAPESLDGVIRMCMCVARVAGGLFGLAFTMDPRERELIGEISRSLQLGPTLTAEARAALGREPVPGRSIADDDTTIFAIRKAPVEERSEPAPAKKGGKKKPSTSKRLADHGPDDTTLQDRDATTAPIGQGVDAHAETPIIPGRRRSVPPAARQRAEEAAAEAQRQGYGRPAGETLLPPDEDEDSSTMPLASLKRMLEEEEATEVDIPMLPQEYDFDFD